MSQRQVRQWRVAIILGMLLLGGCGNASPTPIVIAPAPTLTPLPPIPTAALAIATTVPPTDLPTTVATELTTTDLTAANLTTTAEGTATLGTVPATENPIDQPFLMKIDKFSLIVGRGMLLEGRVVHGTLRGNDRVEILGPQNKDFSTSVLAVLISNAARDQVTVGDYAGILVQAMQPSELSPGMVLAASGAFASYEDALEELQ
jgi:translation elongation factor EF-Tu-like GTPase